MLRSGRKNTLLLLLIIINFINLCQCLKKTTDSFDEDNKRKLANEINDSNEYMQMIAEQISNNDLIVVRATRTKFKNADAEDEILKSNDKSEALLNPLVGNPGLCKSEQTAAIVEPVKSGNELSFKRNDNVSMIGDKLFSMKKSGVTMKNEIPDIEIRNF